jgi:DNA modification methylase
MIERNVVYHGHVLDILKGWPNGIINCVVTSPPYWGQRLYKDLEPQVWGGDKDCLHAWTSFVRKKSRSGDGWARPSRAVHPERQDNLSMFCMKCDAWKGDLGNEPFINLYVTHLCDVLDEVRRVLRDDGTMWLNLGDKYYGSGFGSSGKQTYLLENNAFGTVTPRGELPNKCMADLPHRVVIELVNRGWVHRQTVIWHKPNVLPESVDDRPSIDYEYLFMMTKKPHYYYEQQFEPIKEATRIRAGGRRSTKDRSRGLPPVGGLKYTDKASELPNPSKFSGKRVKYRDMRNLRSVWSIPVYPYKGAHFAVFPPDLIKRPIMASCPKGGIVLDPFLGTGTTALVARALGRDWVGIELSEDYISQTYKRLNT